MKKLLRLTLLSMCTAFVSAPVNASTYNIIFDDSAIAGVENWFGNFEAPTGGGDLTSFLATISGVNYDTLNFVFPPGASLDSSGDLHDWVTDAPYADGILTLFFFTSGNYGLGSCNFGVCNALAAGTFVISAAPSAVPIPAALPLLAAGLSAMGFMGWRKKRKAVS